MTDRMTRFAKWTPLLLAAVAAAGCSQTTTTEEPETPSVYTTFYPTTYFTTRIGGEHVKVVCPIPDDEDPIFWQPPAETIAEYQGADLIVVNGADFEKWFKMVSLPASKVVDTARPFRDGWLKIEGTIGHSHGAGDVHTHEGTDGHTWLDPNYAKVQAEEICKALEKLLPDHAEEFRANYDALAKDLDALHESLEELTGLLKEEHLLASHPAYGYPVDRYGWNVTDFDLDPEAVADEETVAVIRTVLAEKPARIILWESQPIEETSKLLADELGLKSVEFSPCELLSKEEIAAGDYLSVMKENIERLSAALAE